MNSSHSISHAVAAIAASFKARKLQFRHLLAPVFVVQAVHVTSVGTAVGQCFPIQPEENAIVVCDGESTDLFESDENDLDLRILSSARIDVTGGPAIRLTGSGSQFSNRGAVTADQTFALTSGAVILEGGPIMIPGQVLPTSHNFGLIETDGSTALLLSGIAGVIQNEEMGIIKSDGAFFSSAVTISSTFKGAFINKGKIEVSTGTALNAGGSADNFIHNTVTGTINNTSTSNGGGFCAGFFAGSPSSQFLNDGLIEGVSGLSVGGNSTDSSQAVNSSSGIIKGRIDTALLLSHANFVNEGVLIGANSSLSGANYSFTNRGIIYGDVTGNGGYVQNHGTIDGDIAYSDFGRSTLDNHGTVLGSVSFGAQADIFRSLGGEISGRLTLGGGDDVFLVRLSEDQTRIIGGIDAGAGYDSFGYSVSGQQSIVLARQDGFDGHAIEVAAPSDHGLIDGSVSPINEIVTLFGSGTVTTNANIIVNEDEAIRLQSNVGEDFDLPFFGTGPNLQEGQFGTGVHFVNNALVRGRKGVAIRSTFFREQQNPSRTQTLGNERVENHG